MQRLSAAKACFLSDSTEDTPKPDELLQKLNEVIREWFCFSRINSIKYVTYNTDREEVNSSYLLTSNVWFYWLNLKL